MTQDILLKIGEWQLHIASNSLSQGDKKQTLTPQLCELLQFLALHPGQVFSRDELIEKACRGIVSDAAINQAIARLRKHLGDNSREARYIETVAKRGYRLIAEVEQVTQQRQVAAIKHKTRSLWMAAAAMLLLSAISILYIVVSSQPTVSDFEPAARQLRPLTSATGVEVTPSMHSLGNVLAFSQKLEGSNQFDIALRHLNSGLAQVVTQSENASELHPAWSPDGRSIAFVSHSEAGCEIKLLAVNTEFEVTGKTQKIADCSPFDIQLSWHPDGKQLIYNRSPYKGGPLRIYATNVISGETRELSKASRGITGDVAFDLSPDGKQLALIRTYHWNQSELWLLNLETNQSQQLAKFPYWIRSLTWDREGESVIFAKAPLYRQLVHYNIATQRSTLLLERDAVIGDLTRHPLTGEFLLVETRYNYDIVSQANPLRESDDLNSTPDPERQQILVSSTRQDWHPMIGPSGESLAFLTDRTGSTEIWLKDLQTGAETQLTKFQSLNTPFRMQWSPDGRSIVFDSTDNNLSILSIDNLEVKTLSLQGQYARNPRWTDQGIYFSTWKGDQLQLWKYDLNNQQSAPVITEGAFSGEPRQDATKGYLYTKFYKDGFWVNNGSLEETQLMPEASQGPFNQWQQMEDGLYYLATGTGGRLTTYYYNFSSGVSTQVVQFSSRDLSGFSVSSDGKQIYRTLVKDQSADIMLTHPANKP